METESECFSQDELNLLNPTANRIAVDFERLSPTHQLNAIAIILSAIRRQHRLDDSLDLVEFVLGQGIEQQYEVAA